MRNQPLTCCIDDGEIVIRIGVDTLKFALEHSPDQRFYDVDESGEFVHVQISDADGFARDVVNALEREAEDGTTPLHELLEDASYDAIENGAEDVLLPEDTMDARAKGGTP